MSAISSSFVALHDDRVDLDRTEARFRRGVDSLEHLSDSVAEAGHAAEDVVVQRLDADGDPVEAGVRERLRLLRQQGAVRRQGEVLDSRHRGQNADQILDVAPQQGLATGQPQLAHAKLHEQPHQPLDLLERHQLPPRQEPVLAVRRHAEGAAEGCSDR